MNSAPSVAHTPCNSTRCRTPGSALYLHPRGLLVEGAGPSAPPGPLRSQRLCPPTVSLPVVQTHRTLYKCAYQPQAGAQPAAHKTQATQATQAPPLTGQSNLHARPQGFTDPPNPAPPQPAETLLPTAIRKAALGAPIPIYGDGQNIRDWLYVEDHARGLIEACGAAPGSARMYARAPC